MKDHYELSDIEFEIQFENCLLDPAIFTHEAHLRLAWIHIEKYGIIYALENIQNQLMKFVAHVGAKDKYNKTLTIAAVKAVFHFKQKSKSVNFRDFINEFPQLNHSFKRLIYAHYSFDIFNNQRAKIEFLEPDLVPFT